jgi:hypothetical protein
LGRTLILEMNKYQSHDEQPTLLKTLSHSNLSVPVAL